MKPIFNRAPLTPNSRAALSLGHIEPEGWLKEQLRAQADGLSGKLFDIWPDVGENCGWLGGNGDAWERAPYYLDGLVPLAWLLGDERLKQICLRYIEWILASQREDGFFGPASNEDWWPRMVVLKALIQYFQATLDKRVLVFMDKYFQYQKKMLDAKPLRDWAVARGGENMQAVIWLYNITGQKYLLDLLSKLRQQTLDWPNHFHTFPDDPQRVINVRRFVSAGTLRREKALLLDRKRLQRQSLTGAARSLAEAGSLSREMDTLLLGDPGDLSGALARVLTELEQSGVL